MELCCVALQRVLRSIEVAEFMGPTKAMLCSSAVQVQMVDVLSEEPV